MQKGCTSNVCGLDYERSRKHTLLVKVVYDGYPPVSLVSELLVKVEDVIDPPNIQDVQGRPNKFNCT